MHSRNSVLFYIYTELLYSGPAGPINIAMSDSYLSKDKFGFYQVGDFRTYSKVEAIELSNKIGKPLHWNFNDLQFSAYDWTVEPTESLKELYQRRARQIRERYDYIVLWWSGGADSYTMLRAFVDAGLFVDELATFHNYGGDGDWDSYLNSEVKRMAMPVAQEILSNSPNTKFRLVELSDLQKNLYDKDGNRFDFLYKANAVFSPNQLARTRYIRETEKDYQDLFAQGKRVCFVWGMDKPRISYELDGRYAIRFVDILDNCVNPETQRLNRPWENDEFFYWSPDSKDLLCKQAHVIVRYLKNIPEQDVKSRWLMTKPNALGFGKFNGRTMFLTNDGLHRLIYEDWNPDNYSSGKHTYLMMWSPRDEWYLKDTNAEHTQIYSDGLKKLNELVGNNWVKRGGITRGLTTCASLPWYIE